MPGVRTSWAAIYTLAVASFEATASSKTRTPMTACTLSALRVWGAGSRLKLEPPFSSDVGKYKAGIDFGATAIWVDTDTQDGCTARRSDSGVPVGADGLLSVLVARAGIGLPAEEPREYSVALTRSAGDETELEGVYTTGASKLRPGFAAGVAEYTIALDSSGDEVVEISVAPSDMGQGLRVSIDGNIRQGNATIPVTLPVPETPAGLAQLQHRRRNFTLGRVVAGGAALRVPGSQAEIALPAKAKIEVWPAVATANGMGHQPAGPSSRTFVASLQSQANGDGSGREHGGQDGLHVMFSLAFTATLGALLCCVLYRARWLPPQVAACEWSPSERAEQEVQKAFQQARESLRQGDPAFSLQA